MQLKDKVVVITGAARGIGKAFAVAVLEKGAKVMIVDILEEAGKKTTEELCGLYGNRVIFFKYNVTNKEDCKGVFKQAAEEFGHVDILINNAGIYTDSIDAYDEIVAVNLTAVVTMTYLAVDHMSKEKGGSGGIIVNIASIAGVDVLPGSELYTATKHAVTGFTRTMAANARENPSKGLKIFTLGPGWVRTDMTKGWHQHMDEVREKTPAVYKFIQDTGGFVEPEVISKALLSLLSEEPAEEDFMLVTAHGTKYLNLREFYGSALSC